MLRKSMSISVHLDSGKETYSFDQAAQFEFMTQGLFFIQEKDRMDIDQVGKIVRKKTIRNKRVWYPISRIKKVEIDTKSVLDGEEVKKYDVFLKHGIDITRTQISHTEPLAPAEIEKALISATEDKKAVKQATEAKNSHPEGGEQS